MRARRAANRHRRYAVILAGGYGTRFWPRSRQRLPKQFLAIGGRHSLLQETVTRVATALPRSELLVVAGAEYAPAIRRQLPRLPSSHLLIEPAKRGTAPCIAMAAEWIARRDPQATMAVFPADHAITVPIRFRRAVARAVSVAEREACLVTFGVRPTRVETGYGYIEGGATVDGETPAAYWARRFHEKPDPPTARAYVDAGYLWNAGMFVWRVDVVREAFARLAPDIAAAMRVIEAPRRFAAQFRRLPAVSVDVSIMERFARVAVVEADFGWSDVGNWSSLAEVWGTDKQGNATRGPTVVIDSSDTLVYADRRLIAVVGMDDVIVVDSPDALLICRKRRAQDVRLAVEALAAKKLRRYR